MTAFPKLTCLWLLALSSFALHGRTQPEERVPLLGPLPIPLSRMQQASSGNPGSTVFRDPETGFSFRHPNTWSATAASDRIVLTPSETAPGDASTMQVFITGEEAPDLARLDDPRVLDVLDRVAHTLLPGSVRKGVPRVQRRSDDQRMDLLWQVEREGVTRCVRIWAWLSRQHVVCLCAVGTAANLDARSRDLAAMADSFAFAAAQRDPRLIGTWKTTSYTFGKDFNRYLILAPDGSCFQSTTLDSDFVPGPGNAEDRGTWELRDRTLLLRWQKDGVQRAEVSYQVTDYGTYLHFVGDRWEKVR